MSYISQKKYKSNCIKLLIAAAFFLLVGVISAIIAKSLLYFLTWLVVSLAILLCGSLNFYYTLFYKSIMAKSSVLEGKVIEYDCRHKATSIIVETSDNKEYETPKYFYANEAIKLINRNVSFFVRKKKVFINEVIAK